MNDETPIAGQEQPASEGEACPASAAGGAADAVHPPQLTMDELKRLYDKNKKYCFDRVYRFLGSREGRRGRSPADVYQDGKCVGEIPEPQLP